MFVLISVLGFVVHYFGRTSKHTILVLYPSNINNLCPTRMGQYLDLGAKHHLVIIVEPYLSVAPYLSSTPKQFHCCCSTASP